MVLTFSEGVRAADGTLDETEISLSVGEVSTVMVDGRDMLVEVIGVPDGSCVDLSVSGIEDLAGNALVGDDDVRVKVLLADTNGDDRANLIDMAQVKSMNGAPLVEDTARFDLNRDAAVNLIDMALAKSRNGRSLTCQ
jgi:hypothetical protein